MRVLFLRPNSIIIATPPPLGLGYLAGALRKERRDTIEILDGRNLRWPLSRMRQRVREFRPDVVGISAINFEMEEAHELAAAVKAEFPRVPVVIGGPYASANREAVLSDPHVDIVVAGEGERTVVELFSALESGATLAGVKGIIYREEGQPVFTGERELLFEVDQLEVAWDLLDPPRYFRRWGRSENIIQKDFRTTMIFTSRGCPYSCIFCHNIFGKTFRPRSPENVLDEIQMLVERYNIRELDIVDDSFSQSLRRAKAICRGLVERGMRLHLMLPNGIRGDRTDEEFFDLLAEAGFFRIAFAVESASPRVQQILGKSLDLERVRWAVSEVFRRGMFPTGYFIQGFPTETYEEMLLTGDWAAASDLLVASFFYLLPFPGTPVAKMTNQDLSRVRFRDYSTRVVNLSATSDDLFHRANKYAYRRFYLNPQRLRRIAQRAPKNFRTVLNSWLAFRLLFQDSVNQ